MVLCLWALAHAARAWLAAQQAAAIPELPDIPSTSYVVVVSVAWALVFLACVWGAVRSLPWIAWAAILAGVCNQIHVWIERLAFSRSAESFQTLGFAALRSAVLLLFLALPALVYHLQLKQRT
jgi:hypothetical protein